VHFNQSSAADGAKPTASEPRAKAETDHPQSAETPVFRSVGDRGEELTGVSELLLKTDCSNSELANECRRAPKPAAQRPLSRQTALPWNLTSRHARRLLLAMPPLRPPGGCCQTARTGVTDHPYQPVDALRSCRTTGPGSFTFRIYEAAIRAVRRSAINCR
jgi:hypothetical protein